MLGLSDLFNLPNLVEEVVSSIVEGGVGAVVEGSKGDVETQIKNAGKEVCSLVQ
jgi:hypothetical protein